MYAFGRPPIVMADFDPVIFNVANGIAQLDASADIEVAQAPPTMALVTTGIYTGNDVDNRTIPHGLGIVPKKVFISNDGVGGYWSRTTTIANMDYITNATPPVCSMRGVGACDATNILVGDTGNMAITANLGAETYQWVAIA